MTCQEVDELAAVFALGAMPHEEREAVREHIATCARHERLFAGLHSTVAVLDDQVDLVEAPASLRAQILQAVRESDTPRPVSPIAEVSTRRPGWRIGRFSFQPLLGIAAAIIAALLIWNVALQFGGTDDADAFVLYMHNEDDQHAWVYYVEQVGVITVEGLVPLPEGMNYEAWANTGDERMSLGLVPVSASGDGYVLLDQHVSKDARVWITVETNDGDPAPSGRTVLSTEN